ncbi:MAG: hypothetical protein JST39_13480, partial [Bacteroidetes bacterium]|nr:hypothetical protein [Bacteroidota bacterium]
ENRNHLLMVMLLYGFFGVFIGVLVLNLPSFLLAMIIVHTYFIFMMAMTLVTDFATVLLDTTDNQVILPRPVSGQTLFVARLLHILIYLLQFTIALALVPVLFTAFKYGPLTALGMCVSAPLSILLAVFFTYLLYLLILRFSSEQRLKDIITYFQIAITVAFTVSLQILPRMIGVLNFDFTLHWYSYLLPPVWMAMALEPLHTFHADALHGLMIVCAVFLPLLLFWVLNKFLAPSFARKLAAMNTESTPVAKATTAAARIKPTYSARISGLFCRSAVEKGSFETAWKITSRDKGFRMQFYPSLGYIPVFIFIFVFKNASGAANTWNNLGNTQNFLWFIYIPVFTIANSLILLAFNENFAASWIYHSMPVERPGELITGSLKALFVKYFMPVFLLLLAVSLYIWGPAVIDDFIFGFFNNILCYLLLTLLSDYYLPFSRQPNTQVQTGRFVRALLQMLMIGVLVGIHYLVLKRPVIMYALLPFSIGGCWLLWRQLKNIPWNKIAV